MIKSLAFLGASTGTTALRRDFQWMDDSPTKGYTVVEIYERHDPSFIQGLYWDQDRQQLIESVGWYGSSRTQWLTIQEELGIVRP